MSQSVYMIDDHQGFRESAGWLIEGMGYKVIPHESPLDLIAALGKDNADADQHRCLLMDIRMPEMSGMEIHEQLKRDGHSIPVIYMTGHADIALAVEGMQKGAISFLEKPLNPDDLKASLELAFRAYESATQSAAHLRVASQQELDSFKEKIADLTPREKQVMGKIVEGKLNKQTAYELDISIKTVELHRSRVMKKLPVRTSQELVKMVMLCH